ncbi:hypothetical protein BD414DRAFT_581669 [Trametes punicea]|nr:hypothetical protein BD414DRAFT_581669 [Trametes punicea]
MNSDLATTTAVSQGSLYLPFSSTLSATQDPAWPSASSARATGMEPDCLCWSHSKESLLEPAALDQILDTVRDQYKRSLVKIRKTVISLIENDGRISSPEEEARTLSKKTDIIILQGYMMMSLEHAIMTISQAPGYIFPKLNCKNTFDIHLALLSQRDHALGQFEEDIKEVLAEAKQVFEARDTLVGERRTLRRRRAVQIGARTAVGTAAQTSMFIDANAEAGLAQSLLTLPFVPWLSAVFCAIDMGVSVFIGFQDMLVTDEELASTTTGVDNLRRDMNEKIAIVGRMRVELKAIKDKVLAQRESLAARQLLYLLVKLKFAKTLVERAFGLSGLATSLCDAVQAMHSIMPILGVPISPSDISLVCVPQEPWQRLDEDLAAFRASRWPLFTIPNHHSARDVHERRRSTS